MIHGLTTAHTPPPQCPPRAARRTRDARGGNGMPFQETLALIRPTGAPREAPVKARTRSFLQGSSATLAKFVNLDTPSPAIRPTPAPSLAALASSSGVSTAGKLTPEGGLVAIGKLPPED